jgi:hypothetical protein
MSDFAKGRTDPLLHKRYLEYRERHGYFGKAERILTLAEYGPLEKELSELEAKGEEARDDEEAARFDELAKVLFRD